MSAQRFVVQVWLLGLAAAGLLLASHRAPAQGLGEMNAAMNMNDSLDGGSTAVGVGSIGLGRARQAAATANSVNQGQMSMSGLNGGTGAPREINVPSTTFTPPAPVDTAPSGMTVEQLAQMAPTGPKITVISGVRVFDAISGELVDDVIKKKVDESEKDKYFDDGTHGDMVAGDEIYTRVDGEQRDVIGAASQKVKERMITALKVAADYGPIEFYGYTLMSTDRQQPIPRNEAWTLTKDPSGGPGLVLAERAVDKPIEVPKYRDKMREKDAKVKDDWSLRFLQEYRKKKDDLSSEFFPVYLPQPPRPPATLPPVGWTPFADPTASQKAKLAENPIYRNAINGNQGGAGGAGGIMQGMSMGMGM